MIFRLIQHQQRVGISCFENPVFLPSFYTSMWDMYERDVLYRLSVHREKKYLEAGQVVLNRFFHVTWLRSSMAYRRSPHGKKKDARRYLWLVSLNRLTCGLLTASYTYIWNIYRLLGIYFNLIFCFFLFITLQGFVTGCLDLSLS